MGIAGSAMAILGSLRIADGTGAIIKENIVAALEIGPRHPGARAFGRKAVRRKSVKVPAKPLRRRTGSYSQNLAKLFPAEAATVYPLALVAAGDNFWIRLALVGLIAGVVFWYRYLATQPKGGGQPDWTAIIISTVSFLLYVASLGGFGILLETQERTTALFAVISGLWILVVPELSVKRVTSKPRPPKGDTLAARLARQAIAEGTERI